MPYISCTLKSGSGLCLLLHVLLVHTCIQTIHVHVFILYSFYWIQTWWSFLDYLSNCWNYSLVLLYVAPPIHSLHAIPSLMFWKYFHWTFRMHLVPSEIRNWAPLSLNQNETTLSPLYTFNLVTRVAGKLPSFFFVFHIACTMVKYCTSLIDHLEGECDQNHYNISSGYWRDTVYQRPLSRIDWV